MGEIVQYKPKTAIQALRDAQTSKAVQVLTESEKSVYSANIKKLIKEYEPDFVFSKLSAIFKRLAETSRCSIDAEYVSDAVRRHFGDLSLEDVKMAFESVSFGELDRYLPRDNQGQPDRKSYGSFSTEYVARVLNAYRRLKDEVTGKIYAALPTEEIGPSKEELDTYYQELRNQVNQLYKAYKNTGRLDFGVCGDFMVFQYLKNKSLVRDVTPTDSDRKKALGIYLHRASMGLVNKYTAHNTRRDGIKSENINFYADEVAREKEIKRLFDEYKKAGK